MEVTIMLEIDMLEEPDNECDFIFRAQNIEINNELSYRIPVQDNNGEVSYVTRELYEYILDNIDYM